MRLAALLFWVLLGGACLAADRRDSVANCFALLDALEQPFQLLHAESEPVWLRAAEVQLGRALRMSRTDFEDLSPEDRPFAPVWKLPFSVRTQNKLQKAGIRTLGQLTELSAEDLAEVSAGRAKVGQIAAAETVKTLSRYGLPLRPKRVGVTVRAATDQDAAQVTEIDKQFEVESLRDYLQRGVGVWVAEANGKIIAFSVLAHLRSADASAQWDAVKASGLADDLGTLKAPLYSVIRLGVRAPLQCLGLREIYQQMYAVYPDAHFVVNLSGEPDGDLCLKAFHSHQGFLHLGSDGVYVRLR